MRPTFSGFYVAKRGLDAARANLSVTGQNMVNANTPGYTRQRVDLFAIGASSVNMRYANKNANSIGEGVSIGAISQIRDPYLDVRYRREHARLGDAATQLDTLTDLKDIFDEISKDGIDAQFNELFKQLENLSRNPNDPVSEGIVKTAAKMLIQMFNDCAYQVENVRKEELGFLQDSAITTVNDLLNGISHLNGEIKSAHVAGNPALELQDQRNMMLDELSGYMNIELSTKMVDVGGGVMVEEVSVNLIGEKNERFRIIDGDENVSLTLGKDANGNVTQPVKILMMGADGMPVGGSNLGTATLVGGDISAHLTTGALNGHLKMLNTSGEFEQPAGTTQRGIGYYENMLDTLANTFAEEFNKINSMNTQPPWDKPMFEAQGGYPLIDIGNANSLLMDGYKINVSSTIPSGVNNTDKVITINLPQGSTYQDLQDALAGLTGLPAGVDPTQFKVDAKMGDQIVFGNDLSSVHINAKNISISEKWENTTGSYLTATKDSLEVDDEGNPIKGNNILAMIALLSSNVNYNAPVTGVPIFKGTFQGFFANISTTLGLETKDAKRKADSFSIVLTDIDTQRASMSSVNVDEEGINLIQFNHSLTAASRYMTTLDEAVDLIINKMGIVGR